MRRHHCLSVLGLALVLVLTGNLRAEPRAERKPQCVTFFNPLLTRHEVESDLYSKRLSQAILDYFALKADKNAAADFERIVFSRPPCLDRGYLTWSPPNFVQHTLNLNQWEISCPTGVGKGRSLNVAMPMNHLLDYGFAAVQDERDVLIVDTDKLKCSGLQDPSKITPDLVSSMNAWLRRFLMEAQGRLLESSYQTQHGLPGVVRHEQAARDAEARKEQERKEQQAAEHAAAIGKQLVQ